MASYAWTALIPPSSLAVSFDQGLPVALRVVHGQDPPVAVTDASVVKLHDQHAFLRVRTDNPITLGDRVELGISHPCTTFDKWRLIPVVDGSGVVIDAIKNSSEDSNPDAVQRHPGPPADRSRGRRRFAGGPPRRRARVLCRPWRDEATHPGRRGRVRCAAELR